jgi:hypothetical protein
MKVAEISGNLFLFIFRIRKAFFKTDYLNFYLCRTIAWKNLIACNHGKKC